ncbi:hypothetical protein HDU93_001591 [Gonapodya sp. JEL0774]|nr:hypothetical protein HDU93_001591 [Gonapodya sp. JEL0774]
MTQGAIKKKSNAAKPKSGGKLKQVLKRGANLHIAPKRPSVIAAVTQHKRAAAVLARAVEESAARVAASTGKLNLVKDPRKEGEKGKGKDGKGKAGGKK